MDTTELNFGEALAALEQGKKVSRSGWNNPNIWVMLQSPDENSKMTKPYLYMVKNDDKFPLDMSCESILGKDWKIIE